MKKPVVCELDWQLHRDKGVWAYTMGQRKIIIDPGVFGRPGSNALLWHETYHIIHKHAMWSVIAFVVCCLTVVLIPLYWLVRRRMETLADRYALENTDEIEFVQFCMLHEHPKSWFGKFLYGRSADARILRTVS